MKFFLSLIIFVFLNGCVSVYQDDLELRLKILERKMSLMEKDFDEILDVCP